MDGANRLKVLRVKTAHDVQQPLTANNWTETCKRKAKQIMHTYLKMELRPDLFFVLHTVSSSSYLSEVSFTSSALVVFGHEVK